VGCNTGDAEAGKKPRKVERVRREKIRARSLAATAMC